MVKVGVNFLLPSFNEYSQRRIKQVILLSLFAGVSFAYSASKFTFAAAPITVLSLSALSIMAIAVAALCVNRALKNTQLKKQPETAPKKQISVWEYVSKPLPSLNQEEKENLANSLLHAIRLTKVEDLFKYLSLNNVQAALKFCDITSGHIIATRVDIDSDFFETFSEKKCEYLRLYLQYKPQKKDKVTALFLQSNYQQQNKQLVDSYKIALDIVDKDIDSQIIQDFKDLMDLPVRVTIYHWRQRYQKLSAKYQFKSIKPFLEAKGNLPLTDIQERAVQPETLKEGFKRYLRKEFDDLFIFPEDETVVQIYKDLFSEEEFKEIVRSYLENEEEFSDYEEMYRHFKEIVIFLVNEDPSIKEKLKNALPYTLGMEPEIEKFYCDLLEVSKDELEKTRFEDVDNFEILVSKYSTCNFEHLSYNFQVRMRQTYLNEIKSNFINEGNFSDFIEEYDDLEEMGLDNKCIAQYLLPTVIEELGTLDLDTLLSRVGDLTPYFVKDATFMQALREKYPVEQVEKFLKDVKCY